MQRPMLHHKHITCCNWLRLLCYDGCPYSTGASQGMFSVSCLQQPLHSSRPWHCVVGAT